MKYTKRLTALLLTVLMLASCASSPDETADENNSAVQNDTAEAAISEDEETELSDGLPDTDMEGFTLTFYHHDQTWLGWALNTMEAEEMNGERLNDAIYERNVAIEDRFNCNLAFQICQSRISTAEVDQLAMSADDSYDVVMLYDLDVATCFSSLYNWASLPYVQLDEAWWNPEASKMFNIGGVEFSPAGNFSLSVISRAGGYVFNRDMLKQYGMENPYDAVKEGSWTIDKMYTMAGQCYLDLNGDGKMDTNDSYGIISSPKEQFLRALFGCEVFLITQDDEGYPVFSLYGDEEKYTKMQHIIDLSISTNGFLPGAAPDIHGSAPEYSGAFKNGRALFEVSNPKGLASTREYEFDLGFIVCPKWDEVQKNYYSPSFGAEVPIIIKTLPASRTENVGMLLEAMAFHSNFNLIPEYTETLVKTKYARDAETAEMLQLAFDTIYFDFGINVWQETVATPLINGCFFKLNGDFGSKLKSVVKQIEKKTEKYRDIVESNY